MRTAIITGATRGIGKGLLLRLMAGDSVKIAAVYHKDEKSAAELKRICGGKNTELILEKLDISNFNDIMGFVDRVNDQFGRIDYLVNNVGTDIFKSIQDVTFEEWKKSQDIILNAPFIFCKSVLPYMREKKFGRIVNIGASSKDYMKGAAGLGPFGIHKAALNIFTKTLALEEIKNGITVNMVSPGSTEDAGIAPADKRIPVSLIPMGRRVIVDEVVEAIIYFLSDKAGGTTGQFIGVNGGMST